MFQSQPQNKNGNENYDGRYSESRLLNNQYSEFLRCGYPWMDLRSEFGTSKEDFMV